MPHLKLETPAAKFIAFECVYIEICRDLDIRRYGLVEINENEAHSVRAGRQTKI